MKRVSKTVCQAQEAALSSQEDKVAAIKGTGCEKTTKTGPKSNYARQNHMNSSCTNLCTHVIDILIVKEL